MRLPAAQQIIAFCAPPLLFLHQLVFLSFGEGLALSDEKFVNKSTANRSR